MATHYVVIVHRDRYYWPKLSISVQARVKTPAAGERFIARCIMSQYAKRCRGKFSAHSSMRVAEMRVVDAEGLKRLRAAAQASATLRRRRGAKKAAITRLRNRGVTLRVDRNTLTYTIIPKQ
jgi:hypothetical protein